MRRVLVVGSGAREHAIAWKLRQSADIERLFMAPGNPGTARLATNLPVSATDIDGLRETCASERISLVVIGPEAPLALGLANVLRRNGVLVVGPDAEAARIESSKWYAKELMARAGVPTAAYATFDRYEEALTYANRASYPLVVKVDGLAAGKGVTLCTRRAQAKDAIRHAMADGAFGAAGSRIVIEEMLNGPEVSLIALVDGERAVALPVAQDHKRLGDGDTGPNTGGMGAYAPVPLLTASERDELVRLTITPVVEAMAQAGAPYRGFLFAGLMLTPDGPRVLEYNCRLGDPETQVILPLVDGDLLPWLEAVAGGHLEGEVPVRSGSAVGVVLAAPGYPHAPQLGSPIDGLDECMPDLLVFHAGTATNAAGQVVTSGGRVLTVVGLGTDVAEAARRAYSAPIRFTGMQRRSDIGHRAGKSFTFGLAHYLPEPARPLPQVGVLASGAGSNLQALLDATAEGMLRAEIAVVVSNNPLAGALDRARLAGVPTLTVPLANQRDDLARAHFEAQILTRLEPYRLDLIVLAGWMLILSADFLSRCDCPVLNVHPAFLPMEGAEPLDIPVLRGEHAVRDALALRLPYTGVSVHRVTPEVDAGPVVCRQVVRIMPDDDQATLYQRIKRVEHRLLPAAVQATVQPMSMGGTYARIHH